MRTAWQRHGLGLPPRPTATPTTPVLDPAFVALNRGLLPARDRPAGELAAWVRREEEYATLGANVVVELNSESHARRSTTRAWAIIRRADALTATPATVKASMAAALANPVCGFGEL